MQKPSYKWSQEEIDFLYQNYPSGDIKQMAMELKRTERAILHKVNQLKIKRTNINWTEEEIKFLTDNYSSKNIGFISEKLNKTRSAITNKAFLLKLTDQRGSGKSWTQEELNKLRKLILDGLTHQEISNILGRTYSSIDNKCKKENIVKNKVLMHGLSKNRLYQIYKNMIYRCYKDNAESYCYYGARGITVCQEWLDDILSFYNWSIENGYSDDLTIDRIDNDGNYCPENCRWITNAEQQNNKRDCFYITAFGETKNVKQWSKDSRCSSHYSTIINRIRAGKSPEEAITTPGRKRKIFN